MHVRSVPLAVLVLLAACGDSGSGSDPEPVDTTVAAAPVAAVDAMAMSLAPMFDAALRLDAGAPQDATVMSAPDTDSQLLAQGWELVWADEFSGNAIDQARWQHDVNCNGGGNNEDQCYVADAKNSFIADGQLHLVALADTPTGAVGGPGADQNLVSKGHSSAKLLSRGMGDLTYGRIEVRARLPFGQGIWPAIWMMPTDAVYGGWARSGEIDIMEAINLKAAGAPANRVHGTLHYGGQWPDNVYSGTEYDPPADVTTLLHTYALEWERGEIRWFVDDVHYATQNTWYSAGSSYPAPFDQRFYLILNLAVGGDWPGYPDATTRFPQELVIDYVRVYQCSRDPDTGVGCGTSDAAVVPLAGNAGP